MHKAAPRELPTPVRHIAEALRNPATPVRHIADALRKPATPVRHTAEALRKPATPVRHTDEALRKPATPVRHIADALRKSATPVRHTDEALRNRRGHRFFPGFFVKFDKIEGGPAQANQKTGAFICQCARVLLFLPATKLSTTAYGPNSI